MNEKILKLFIEQIKDGNDGKHVDIMVPGYASKRVKAYQSMRADLILIRDATNLLRDNNYDHVITSSLYHTIIILYGKCFTDATFSKYPKLEEKDCFDEKHSHLFEAHKSIMELRHNFAAHRGSTEHEMAFAYLKLNIKDLSKQVGVKQLKRMMPKEEDLPLYLELFEYLIDVVEKKFEIAANKLWDHMVKEYSPERMAGLKIAGPTKREKDIE